VKTIVEASVKVKFAYVYNSKMTYSTHLHRDYEHAQTLFSRVPYPIYSHTHVLFYPYTSYLNGLSPLNSIITFVSQPVRYLELLSSDSYLSMDPLGLDSRSISLSISLRTKQKTGIILHQAHQTVST
jgi:hypothetical protein